MAGTHLLPEVVGEAHARDLLLTGRVVDADEALRIGLVSRVLEPATFLDDVLGIAAGVAGNAPIATRLTKLALLDGGHRDIETALQWEALAQPVTLATADLQEGIRASKEKRAPRVPRPLTAGGSGPDAAKPPCPPTETCLPLADLPRRARGPRLRATLGARSGEGNAARPHPVDKPVDNSVHNPLHTWRTRLEAVHSPVENRGISVAESRTDQRERVSTGCGAIIAGAGRVDVRTRRS